MANISDYCYKMGLKVTKELLAKLDFEEQSLFEEKGIILKKVPSMSLIHQDYFQYGMRIVFDDVEDAFSESGLEKMCNKFIVSFYEKITEKPSSLLIFDGQVYISNPEPGELMAVMDFYDREFKHKDTDINPRLRGKNN